MLGDDNGDDNGDADDDNDELSGIYMFRGLQCLHLAIKIRLFLLHIVKHARVKIITIYINNSRHLARKYARIFVRGIICSEKRKVFRE